MDIFSQGNGRWGKKLKIKIEGLGKKMKNKDSEEKKKGGKEI